MAKAPAEALMSIPSVEIQQPPEANILFYRLPEPLIQGLFDMGFRFYHDRWEPGIVRFVMSFSTTAEDVDDLRRAVSSLASESGPVANEAEFVEYTREAGKRLLIQQCD